MDVYDTIATILKSNNNMINGRTALQKLAYFSKIKIASIEITSFIHHYYGPFSREVALALDEMTAFSYIEERTRPGYSFEGYSYTLTNDGIKFADSAKNKFQEESKTIFDIVKKCNDFCNLKVKPLSYAAKAYYILTNIEQGKKEITTEDVERVAKKFDWDISSSDAELGIELLLKLNLVTVS